MRIILVLWFFILVTAIGRAQDQQGGRIESITGVPGYPAIIYAAAGSGGIWKTENGGMSWKPVFEDQPTLAIGDIEIFQGDHNIVWAGTGESLLARSSYPGTGVFKSEDGVSTWENMGLAGTNHIGRIAISAQDPELVYVKMASPGNYKAIITVLKETVTADFKVEKQD